MWGIIPAAGSGTRIQPLAFSKELLPVGSRRDSRGVERPRAVSEYLVERMLHAGADKICFVISPWKADILQYYGGDFARATIAYAIQGQPRGLCDAIFRALPLLHPGESAVVGLPDTIWFPADALCRLPTDRLAFLLFPVQRPELFDAVVTDDDGRVRQIQVKSAQARSRWVWGAFRAPARVMQELHTLWRQRGLQDEYVGTLVNAYIAAGGDVCAVRAGESYVDVGTLHGYREAMHLLADGAAGVPPSGVEAGEGGPPPTASCGAHGVSPAAAVLSAEASAAQRPPEDAQQPREQADGGPAPATAPASATARARTAPGQATRRQDPATPPGIAP